MRKRALNILIITAAVISMMIASAALTFAASDPTANGQVDSESGAYLRKSASNKAGIVAELNDNTKLTITREVFKSRKSSAAKNRWFYVTAGKKKGYIRADLVDKIKYSTVTATVSADKAVYRKGAGTKMKSNGTLKKGTSVTVCLPSTPVKSTNGGSDTWYRIKIKSKYYYVSSSSLSFTAKTAAAKPVTSGDPAFDKYLASQGFPDAYKTKLIALHKAHPKWVFKAKQTGVTWKFALARQTGNGKSLIHASLPVEYRATDKKSYRNGRYIPKDGSTWFNASSDVVAYYMDPRNFLNEDSVYMFEDLSYHKETQTAGVVAKILSPSNLPANGFTAKLFVAAGAKYNISPVHLASRARQETGNGSIAITGYKIKKKKVYNPFNIGASTSKNPVVKGLKYAYKQGWTSQKKAVMGGAECLAETYISKGQNSVYFQRFNVANGALFMGTHQYMTNIMAPYSEANSIKSSYKAYGVSDDALTFIIPVFKDMPASTKLP